jgi:iron complex transport system ATP-binding protein
MTDLMLDGLSVTINNRTLLHPCTACLSPGQFIAVVGANGAGKSTLLRAIAALAPTGGAAAYAGQPLGKLTPAERARRIGYLPQAHDFAWPMPVRDMVALGLYAFGTRIAPAAAAEQADAALATLGAAQLADRPVDRLSGGERAIAVLARVLVADTPILLLDEPVAALDIGRQYQLLEQLKLMAQAGKTVIAVLHDLALVSQFSDRILWIDGGRLIADTANTAHAINAHARALLGRTPRWTTPAADSPATLFFAREKLK